MIYFCGLFGMKLCVLVLFLMLPWISRVGDWALGWTEGNERLQIIFVMMLFPLIMNAMQYYIIDSFIKKKVDPNDGGTMDGEAGGGAYERLGRPESDSFDGEDDDGQRKPLPRAGDDSQDRAYEYDPAIDGDSHTVVGSSSSRTSERDRILPKELYPHE
jgi:hypothetical protein